MCELAVNEHKREDVDEAEAFVQQNKNIIANACILTQLEKLFNVDSGPKSNKSSDSRHHR